MADRVSQQLGNYRLIRLLGRGRFAEVYLGEHVYLKNHAAIKVLHTRLAAEDAQQFLKEAQVLAGLTHPHIVRVLDFAVQDGIPFLVMEYAALGTLRTRHPKQTRVPLDRLVAYVNQAAAALQYAHDHHVIHGDIKPENMLLSVQNDVVLSDFGLALLMALPLASPMALPTPHTLSTGTQPVVQHLAAYSSYLAPEQLQGQPLPASDQYALAVVVYEWLCGTPPFDGSPIETALQHPSVPPLPPLPLPSLHLLLPDLPSSVEEVVRRALSQEPEQRFAQVQDFATSLQRAIEEGAVHHSTSAVEASKSTDQEQPIAPSLHINLLGEFRLVLGKSPVNSIEMPRLQSLLAYLVLHSASPQARSHLAYLLWPDSTDAQALTNLRASVHRLRQALPNADTLLHADRQVLSWRSDTPETPWTLDVLDFEQTLAQADQAAQAKDQRGLRRTLTRAADLYQGDLLPSCYDEWILPERDRLRQAFLRVLEQLSKLLEEERDYETAIRTAQRLLRHDPLHEATYRQLMRLYAVSGDRAAAMRTYHTCASTLERELGIKPGRATQEAYARLIQTERRQDEPIQHPAHRATTPLVGRKQEWVVLQDAWRSATRGQTHMVVLSGEAGIGKTRLAEELLTWVGRQGIATAAARCYAAEGGLAYAPLVSWLRSDTVRKRITGLADVWLTEVARLLPELLADRPHLQRPAPLLESWQRQQLFEALTRALLENKSPLLLLLDDLQWCDHEMLAWLHYLLHFDPQAPLLLVTTARAEEIVTQQELTSLLLSLRREGLMTEITLGPLNAAETTSLANAIVGHSLTPTVAHALYQETEGNPLFVVETARMVSQEEDESERPTISVPSTPSTIQAVIEARLAQLSPAARELVSIAAVIGRAFTLDVLAHASGNNEDTLVRELDELWQRRIVREQGSDAYDFSHDKLREGAYAHLSKARRRLLHRRVAQALEVVHANNLEMVSGQIASHYELAGLSQQAISFYQMAGKVAKQIYAHKDALALLRRASELLATLPVGSTKQEWQQRMTAELYEQVGDVLDMTGQYDEAIVTYEHALAHVPDEDKLWHACLHLKTGNIWPMLGNYQKAQDAYDRAEQALDDEQSKSTVDHPWWSTWIDISLGQMWIRHWPSQTSESTKRVARTRQAVEQYGTLSQQATFFQSCYLMNLSDTPDVLAQETLSSAYARLAAEQQTGNSSQLAWACFDLGLAHMWCGNHKQAEEQMQVALTIGEQTGDATLQARCLTFLAMLYRKRGQIELTHHTSSRVLLQQKAEYQAMAKAHLAWVAWRKGNFAEAEMQAQEALNNWPPLLIVSPFQWTARWPLLAISFIRGQTAEAVEHAQALLAPGQEHLPSPLAEVVKAAVQAWDFHQPDIATTHLQQALSQAKELGYL